ncbi:MAG: DUF6089 family protein [Bacteroidales bacterium]|jgi:hypothetical protein|nr:DUF6089 family protein [Bacteroidales bacterium]
MIRYINISLAVALFSVLSGMSANAQNKRDKTYELHFGVGAVNVFGDVGGGFRQLQLSHTRPVAHLGGRYEFNEYFSGKINLFVGQTAGSNENTVHETRFVSSLYELSGQIEWTLANIKGSVGSMLAKRKGISGSQLTTCPYLFAGMGFAYAEPALEPPYSSFLESESGRTTVDQTGGFVLPIGVGIRTDLSFNWALGLELGGRFTTSDYLDGLGVQSSSDDVYFFTTLHLIYKFHFAGGKRVSGR